MLLIVVPVALAHNNPEKNSLERQHNVKLLKNNTSVLCCFKLINVVFIHNNP